MKKTKVQNRSTKNDPVIKELPLACADEKAAIEFLEKQRYITFFQRKAAACHLELPYITQ